MNGPIQDVPAPKMTDKQDEKQGKMAEKQEKTAKEPDKKCQLDPCILKLIDIRAKQHAAKEVAVCLAAHEKMVKERARTDIKAMTKQFCSKTTAHGVSRVVDADSKTGKFLWTMILLICLTVFLYQASIMIKTYFDYPVVVEIKVVENSKLTFPSVTVCNNNRLRASKVQGTRHQGLVELNLKTAVGISTFLPNPGYPGTGHGGHPSIEGPQAAVHGSMYIFQSPSDYGMASIICREESKQLCTTSQLKVEAKAILPAFTEWAYFSDERFAVQIYPCSKDSKNCQGCIAGRFPLKPADQVNQSHAFCCPVTKAVSADVGIINSTNAAVYNVTGPSGDTIAIPQDNAFEAVCGAVANVWKPKACTASQLLQLFEEGVRFDGWGWFASPLRTDMQIRLDRSCHDKSSTACYRDALPLTTTMSQAGVFCCSPQVCVQSGCTAKVPGCSNPLGMESGKIRDRQIRASSSQATHIQAQHGRLNALSFWKPNGNDQNPRFEVDFEKLVILTGVIIQLDSHASEFVGYMLEYGPNTTAWTRYVDEYGGDVYFCGTVDSDNHYNVQHLPKAIVAKHIAIVPLFLERFFGYNNFHFRVEFLGCDSDDCIVDSSAGNLIDVDDLLCIGIECYSSATTYRGRSNSPSHGICVNWTCPQSYSGYCLQENFCRVPPNFDATELVCPVNGTGANLLTIPCVDIPKCPINEDDEDNTFPTSRTFYQYSFAKQYCRERGRDLCTTEDIHLMKIGDDFSSDRGWFADQKRQLSFVAGRIVYSGTLEAGRAAYCCDKLFRFTEKRYKNHQTASEACVQLGMQLCTNVQLEEAHGVGIRRSKYPEDLAWSSVPDKVALLNDTCGCSVGEFCYKRIIPFHRPSSQSSYKALCCKQMLVTIDQKFDTIHDAASACLSRRLALCSRHQVEEVFPEGTDGRTSGWTWDTKVSSGQKSRVAHCCTLEIHVEREFHDLVYKSGDVNLFKGCNNPLGMEAGTIASDQITANVMLSELGGMRNAPSHARLNGMSSWKMIGHNGWIEIDLRKEKLITGIITQGHGDNYVSTFTLSFSLDKRQWKPYTDDNNGNVVFNVNDGTLFHGNVASDGTLFHGNVDGDTPNHVYLSRTFVARYIHLHPKSWKNRPNLRLEIIGCELDNCDSLSSVEKNSLLTPSDVRCWEKDCIVGTGLNYRGVQNITNSGRNCQKWDSHDPHEHCMTPALFPEAGLEENYCRNIPGSLAKVPWCFTEDPLRPREFCPVEMCDVGCIDSGLATVTSDNDWLGFIQNSRTDDFSDVTDISTATKDEIAKLGHQKEDFIIQCTFDKKRCSLDDFKVSQNSKYGNCFTFNHDQDSVLETTKVGAGYGLKLTLHIESEEYIGIFGQDPGVKVTVHSPGSTPLPEVNALSAEPGKSTFIGLKRRVVSRQPSPYGNCSLSTETSPLYGGRYTYETCKRSCVQRALIKECGCSDELLAINSTICSALNETQECCRQRMRKEHENNEQVCPCYHPCDEESYEVWVSSSSWPSETYTAYVLEKIHSRSRAKDLPSNFNSIKKNLVRLHLYYQDLNYQEIMDVPSFTIEALFSSIGGLLGLYIGLSVITLCEVVHLIVDMVKVLLKIRKPMNGTEEP